MAAQLDHMILLVNDRDRSIEFYTQILGFAHEGDREPFSALRASEEVRLDGGRDSWWMSLRTSQV